MSIADGALFRRAAKPIRSRSETQPESACEGSVRRVAARGKGEAPLRLDGRFGPDLRKLRRSRPSRTDWRAVRIRETNGACAPRGFKDRFFRGVRLVFSLGRPGGRVNEFNDCQDKNSHDQRSPLRPPRPANEILTGLAVGAKPEELETAAHGEVIDVDRAMRGRRRSTARRAVREALALANLRRKTAGSPCERLRGDAPERLTCLSILRGVKFRLRELSNCAQWGYQRRFQPNPGQEEQGMKIVLAQPRGFCAGVVRAIDIVERALAMHGAPIYVRHEVVHNRHVVEQLTAKGARSSTNWTKSQRAR